MTLLPEIRTHRGRFLLPAIHGGASRCRLAQSRDGSGSGVYSSDCAGAVGRGLSSCVEMRSCGCSMVSCPPPPPPPPVISGGRVTVGRRCQDAVNPAGTLYASRQSPLAPTEADKAERRVLDPTKGCRAQLHPFCPALRFKAELNGLGATESFKTDLTSLGATKGCRAVLSFLDYTKR